jgi:hypothetical protein
LGERVVDGPGETPFEVDCADEGEAVGEDGAGEVAEAVEVGEGEAVCGVEEGNGLGVAIDKSAFVI